MRRNSKRGGRAMLIGIEREANGRAKRSKGKAEAEMKSVVRNARMRLYGASSSECDQPEYGTALGRIYLQGHINRLHLEAGNRAAEEYGRYYRLTGIPFPSASAQDISRVRGRGADPNPDAARQAAARVEVLNALLQDSEGSGSIFKRICVLDEGGINETPHNLRRLITALDRLVAHYGLRRDAA